MLGTLRFAQPTKKIVSNPEAAENRRLGKGATRRAQQYRFTQHASIE